MTTTLPERTSVHLREVEHGTDLWTLPPNGDAMVSWMHDGGGMIGWGEAARFEFTGPGQYEQAARTWSGFVSSLGGDAAGAVAFVSFSFDHRGRSVLIVPKVLVTQRDGRSRVTTVGPETPPQRSPIARPVGVRWSEGALPRARWRDAVAEAVGRLRLGELDKVVLARDLLAEADGPIDPRFLLRELAQRHPQCWTFTVDGLIGATPEMLLRRRGDQVTSRVLAGSSWSGDGEHLLDSPSYRDEHDFAVESLLTAIAPHCADVRTSGPSVLRLRNIAHLATDVSATLTSGVDLLGLTAAVHPTAAVGGTPRRAAAKLIAELEDLDRGRYAAPVGWLDASGDGELGIALRCAQLSGPRARLFAGCGIVAESDPDVEVHETDAKFAAVREALSA
ncbi:isochorismate synthase [Saccharopolyspora sp. NPDC049357]|uniref:isochorismate synthase n=1 Tax=Saccharopolyspora sp. NPDC049357 TaxID=3154507 RepID=UPI00342CF6F4